MMKEFKKKKYRVAIDTRKGQLNMKIRGIKRGQTIEILEEINNIPDGTEIIIDLECLEKQISEPQPSLTAEEKLAKLKKLFGI